MGNYRSKLSDHNFKKGTFITPFNNAFKNVCVDSPWSTERMPEYLWMGFILNYYGRKEGLLKCNKILRWLYTEHNNITSPRWSLILRMDSFDQCCLYDYIVSIIEPHILSPLAILYTYGNYPEFSKYFCTPTVSVTQRHSKFLEVLNQFYYQQSNDTTDLKFLVVLYSCLTGKLDMPKEQLKLINEYPITEHICERMRLIRPTIRSMELSLQMLEEKNVTFINNFWRQISKMSDCNLIGIKFPDEEYDADNYINNLQKIIGYLSELLKADNPLDNKMLVLLGMTTYSYKRIVEIVNYGLYNSISARGTIRTVIENYIMIKYLLKHECERNDIWTEFQYYGIGLYKLVLTKSRESLNDLSNSHVDYKYLDILVNEYTMEEYINMDTSYFGKLGIREKAIDVDEKELYGLFYDYDSSYEHGLWGAIRESSLLKCESPAHQYHCVPDYENTQNLKSVWHDCVSTMNKIIHLLDSIYRIPQHLLNEVDKYA
ncbi:MAG: DUF5677 domain-containing protein [Clostridia bacterium]|nr:DUF5677 domain-containing protein [Clostridia bacterium]